MEDFVIDLNQVKDNDDLWLELARELGEQLKDD
jgi:hypothetical protein